jgi:hypothetical protein
MPKSASPPPAQHRNKAPRRDSHGRRGLQPPPLFDFDELGNGTLLSEFETAAVLRISSNTLAAWRGQPAHALRWITLPNGFIRYRVADIRAYLAGGKPCKRGPPRKKASPAPTAKTEIHTEDSAPPTRRRPRARADAAAPQEPAP